jgi:hypothetical protein
METEDVQPQGEPTEPQGTTDPTAVETPQGEIDAAELQTKLDKAVAESRKHEKRSKEAWTQLEALKQQIQQMVEPEKVVDIETKAQQLETELAQERLGRIRERVARQLGLPDSLADVLKGDDEQQMREHAEALLADLPALKPKAQAAREASNVTQPPTQGVTSIKEAAEALKAAAIG